MHTAKLVVRLAVLLAIVAGVAVVFGSISGAPPREASAAGPIPKGVSCADVFLMDGAGLIVDNDGSGTRGDDGDVLSRSLSRTEPSQKLGGNFYDVNTVTYLGPDKKEGVEPPSSQFFTRPDIGDLVPDEPPTKLNCQQKSLQAIGTVDEQQFKITTAAVGPWNRVEVDVPNPNGEGVCGGSADDDTDNFVNDGCLAVATSGPETGTADGGQCDQPAGLTVNNVDDDQDGFINDGCPGVGAVETSCADASDGDQDGQVNDGCPAVLTDSAPSETACGETPGMAVDNDKDGTINDGCPAVPALAKSAIFRCQNSEEKITAERKGTLNAGFETWSATFSLKCISNTSGVNLFLNPVGAPVTITACRVRNTSLGTSASCTAAAGPPPPAPLGERGLMNPQIKLAAQGEKRPTAEGAELVSSVAESGGQCVDDGDDDYDGSVNDGCPIVKDGLAADAEAAGAACNNGADDDGDNAVNDGCIRVNVFDDNDAVATECGGSTDAPDEDPLGPFVNDDTVINDGCPPATQTGTVAGDAEGVPATECTNNTDDDKDGAINDGCAAVAGPPILSYTTCAFSEAEKQWVRTDVVTPTADKSGPGSKNAGRGELQLGTTSPAGPNQPETCLPTGTYDPTNIEDFFIAPPFGGGTNGSCDDGANNGPDIHADENDVDCYDNAAGTGCINLPDGCTTPFPFFTFTHGRTPTTDFPSPADSRGVKNGGITTDPNGDAQGIHGVGNLQQKDQPEIPDADLVDDDWDGDGCPDWDELDKDFLHGRDPFNANDCGSNPNVTGPESGAQCANAVDDDKDGAVNDGCPIVKVGVAADAEAAGGTCTNNADDDADNAVNDGCARVGTFDDNDAVATECGGNTDAPDEDPAGGAAVNDDTVVNDGCPPATQTGTVAGDAESGAQCGKNDTDDDKDGAVNDGCPAVTVQPEEHNYTGSYNVLATSFPASKEGTLTPMNKATVGSDTPVVKAGKIVETQVTVNDGNLLKNNQKLYWEKWVYDGTNAEDGVANTCSDGQDNGGGDGFDTADPDCYDQHPAYSGHSAGYWQVVRGSIVDVIGPNKTVTLRHLFAPPCGLLPPANLPAAPATAPTTPNRLHGLSCTASQDAQQGNYFHCILRLDHTKVGAIQPLAGHLLCYQDAPALGLPGDDVPAADDGNVGAPPPPPYATGDPSQLTGEFNTTTNQIGLEGCFENVGGDPGPNTVVDAHVDAKTLRGFVKVWFNRSNAECAADPDTFTDAPSLQLDLVLAEQSDNFDHDSDGCTDFDELSKSQVKKCGDDPYNPYDSDANFNGVASILLTLVPADYQETGTASESDGSPTGGPGCGTNAVDSDGDVYYINDGCPVVTNGGEANCADNVDNDGDKLVNDGCIGVGSFGEKGVPGACFDAIDAPDEDPATPANQDDEIPDVVNDGCPADGAENLTDSSALSGVPCGFLTPSTCAFNTGCDDNDDNDNDLAVNDGCPEVGLVGGSYFNCIADITHTKATNALSAKAHCYTDNPLLTVNCQAAAGNTQNPCGGPLTPPNFAMCEPFGVPPKGRCGDGLPGSPPPRTQNDIDLIHNTLTGAYDPGANTIHLAGCFIGIENPMQGPNVYADVTIDAHTGQGTAFVFLRQTNQANCLAGTVSNAADVLGERDCRSDIVGKQTCPIEFAEQQPVPLRNADDKWDTDLDGCADRQEMRATQGSGGLRDPLNRWDFIDLFVLGVKDQTVNIADIGATVSRFGSNDLSGTAANNRFSDPLEPPTSNTGYHVSGDRGAPPAGSNTWNPSPADGQINIGEIGAVVAQFGHSCRIYP